MLTLLNIVLFIPLLSFFIISVLGRKVGVYGSMVTACFNVFVALVGATYLFY